MENRIGIASKIVLEADKIIRSGFLENQRINIKVKDDLSFVTPEDQAVEAFIINHLKKYFPNDSFLGEEGSAVQASSDYTWIVDPIDGTTNFIYKQPLFTTSVGLTKGDDLVGGVINIPILNTLVSVVKGQGITINSEVITEKKVSKVTELSKALTIFSIAHKKHLLKINTELYPVLYNSVEKLRIFGSISYEMTQIALGNIDAVVNVGSEVWDVAASTLMVRESGGSVIDFYGNNWTPKSKTLIAANPILAQKLAKEIRSNLATDFIY